MYIFKADYVLYLVNLLRNLNLKTVTCIYSILFNFSIITEL